MQKTFEVTAERTDEYKVIIDESIINEEWLKDFREAFWPLDDAEDVAKDVALTLMRRGIHAGFYEGYGHLKIYTANGTLLHEHRVGENGFAPGIVVHIVSEDDEYYANAKEIETDANATA